MTLSGRSQNRPKLRLILIRKLLIALPLIIVVALLVDGRVPKKGCDMFLELEWGRATVLRVSMENVHRKPNREEAERLRNAIRICRHFTKEFDLTNNLAGQDEVWGTASLINLAVELDDPSLLDQLAAKGHSVTGLPNTLGISTLYVATYRQMGNAIRWSLENGVDPNLADVDGITPLMLAAMNPQSELPSLDLLLDAGANIDSLDSDGRTALVYAIRSDRYENARFLAQAGADVPLAREAMVRELENVYSEMGRDRIQTAIDFLDHDLVGLTAQ